MGNTTTRTRKLTIENNDPASVITVSGDVVERLKGTQHPTDKQQSVSNAHYTGRVDIGAGGDFLHEPPLSTLKLRQDNLNALKENDSYWDKRIKELKANHKKMHDVMEDEYRRAIEEIHGCDDPKKKKETTMPCTDSRSKVLRCYKSHPKEPMKCAKEVQDFANCVDLKRATLVDSKG